ncbi:unnamed protein product [Phyllotreta striolata]|uniref:Rac GTPase-activating protein 1 n=1 Tax=Phyllotreta striolata TaxID=444603 RepID=A0A9N9TNC0_PHYSR|nr:unnamed protein product [Phyllotreta striolata]
MSTPFKTPHTKRPRLENPSNDGSSASDTCSTNSSGDSLNKISLVTLFDEQQRLYQQRFDDRENILESYINFAVQTKLLFEEFIKTRSEFVRLRNEIDRRTEDGNEANRLLKNARKMLDEEHKKRKIAEQERDELKYKIASFCNTLVKDSRNKLVDDIKEQMSTLYPGRASIGDPDRLSAIKEINSTGSILSDISFSRSEDDLDSSNHHFRPNRNWNKRQIDNFDEPTTKKPKSSRNVEIGRTETVRATTTLTVDKEGGPIKATSVIESIPKTNGEAIAPPDLVFESWKRQEGTYSSPLKERNNNFRQHCFQQKTLIMPPNVCSVCEKSIRFGKTALKCKECRLMCHPDCMPLMPLPCIPAMNTPSSKKFTGTVADYTPTSAPMVPSLIVHCVNEIEKRGLKEIGLYRVPGSEKDVKSLKEKFLSSSLSPNLKNEDVYVICGCIKDFLRSLTEPLITRALWNDFITAVRARDPTDTIPVLYEAIYRLPQPNRDTLAFLILHLQRVAQSPDCKMPRDNLAKVFGPTIVGYFTKNPEQLFEETTSIVKVMSHLLNIPEDFWSNFVNVRLLPSVANLQQTPSTDSLLRTPASRLFTPNGRSERTLYRKKREGNLFGTPPAYK